MSNVPKFQKGSVDTYYRKVVVGTTEVEYLFDDGNIQDDLILELNTKQPQYIDHLKVFIFAVRGITTGNLALGGRAKDNASRSCAVYRARPVVTLTHEVFHAIGLYHSHADGPIKNARQKYVYPKYNTDELQGSIVTTGTTDNVMSYTLNQQITTWKWQWKILKSLLKSI